MQVITIGTCRGGAGKTSTTAALAQAAAHKGLKTLAIDLDPQGSLSYFLAADVNRAGAFEVLEGTSPAAQAIQMAAEGLSVIPASWNLQTVASSPGSARRLQTALKPILSRFDICLIDTPPTAGELQYNALMASTALVIPVLADIVSLQGLYQMSDTARQIQKSNPSLTIKGYILTRAGGRSTLARQMGEMIQAGAQEAGIPFFGEIREAVSLREA